MNKVVLCTEAGKAKDSWAASSDAKEVVLPEAFVAHYKEILPNWELSEPFLKQMQPLSVRIDDASSVDALRRCGMQQVEWVDRLVGRWGGEWGDSGQKEQR